MASGARVRSKGRASPPLLLTTRQLDLQQTQAGHQIRGSFGPAARTGEVTLLRYCDEVARAAVEGRANEILRPPGALHRLDQIAVWLAGWQRTSRPSVDHPAMVVFAADHGVCVEGISAFPSSVTAEVQRALEAGVGTAAVMSRVLGVDFEVVDVGVGNPTANLAVEAALTPARFAEAYRTGAAAVDRAAAQGADLVMFGEMGIGNTTAAAAVVAALFGGPVGQWTGRGTGIDDEALERKRDVVNRAVGRLIPDTPPREVLREVGGSELVAIAAGVERARELSLPVILDGFIVTAAVAPLAVDQPGALDHCIAGHCSAEAGHRLLLEQLDLVPLLELNMRLGEGSGALAALSLVKLAAAAVIDVATFAEWAAR